MMEIQNLNKTYDKKSRNANHVLHNVSLTLPDTGFICIVGASGCGKTSLLNAIGGLDDFDNGSISTGNITVTRSGTSAYEKERNNNFSYIFQNYYLLSEHSVAYNIYLGLHSLDLSHKEKLARVKESLEAVNMSRYARRSVSDLSGGQQQRVAIARALARRPKVIFADEPTGNLDEENTINICTLLRKISKTSLVVMVTHEQDTARFFADRIITLDDGCIISDETDWKRDHLSSGMNNTLYTEDFPSEQIDTDSIHIRILKEENAAPVNLTIAVLNDKIIIKTSDCRTISYSKPEEVPVLVEGARPVLTVESMDNTSDTDIRHYDSQKHPSTVAGKGLSFSMMLKEAKSLVRKKSIQRRISSCFLIAMSILTVWIVGDYLTVASVDPHDFIVSDSHVLNMTVKRGPKLNASENYMVQKTLDSLYQDLEATGMDFKTLPIIGASASFSAGIFPQLSGLSIKLNDFSYAPIDYLDESSLVYGRMPQNANEIVIDRWVLDKCLENDGVIQNIITDINQLLGTQLTFFKKKYAPTIVGICDGHEPTVYLPLVAFASVGNMGTETLLLSELQKMYPGTYDDVTLGADECIVITNNAGEGYLYRIGQTYNTNSLYKFKIADAFPIQGVTQYLVLSDEGVNTLLHSMNMMSVNPYFYTSDMQSFRSTLTHLLENQYKDLLIYQFDDLHGEAMAAYTDAATLKADARIIVTLSLIVISIIMLYLLQRSYVQQRLGMIAVYRLLGLPGRKLIGIFAMETLLSSLYCIVPATTLTWIVIAVMNRIEDLHFSMTLPWQAALIVGCCIILYYLLVSLLPVQRLLKLPPARLAAKYDL